MSKLIVQDYPNKLPVASKSRLKNIDAKLVVFHKDGDTDKHEFTTQRRLVDYLEKGDVVVVNDSGVLPASFQFTHLETGLTVEIRLVEHLSEDPTDPSQWKAFAFGEGDWTFKTEERTLPPELHLGDIFQIDSLEALVTWVSPKYPQLIHIQFVSRFNIWDEIYKYGKLVQYSYLEDELELWDQQTIFATRPLSVEAPSASFQLNWKLMFGLINKGVNVVPITHAISLSSTGNADLDAQLPFPEQYWISEDSASKINTAKIRNMQVIAFGTSAMRAVETGAKVGKVVSGWGRSTLKITKNHHRRIFTGILTGMHVPGESHFDLLTNFIDKEILEVVYRNAVERGFLWHEYGDLSLILT